jgi:hypothetical protein
MDTSALEFLKKLHKRVCALCDDVLIEKSHYHVDFLVERRTIKNTSTEINGLLKDCSINTPYKIALADICYCCYRHLRNQKCLKDFSFIFKCQLELEVNSVKKHK